MRRGSLILPLVALIAATSARGSSLDLPFIAGLRDRGYYEYALLEIDRLEADKNLPANLRPRLDFERAITQLQFARSLVNPEARAKELDRAAKALDEFTKTHPGDPLAPKAHAERAQLLLARVELWQVNPSDRSPKASEARAKARGLIAEARSIFQKANDQAKAEYDRFPKVKLADPKEHEDRLRAESDYLRAQLNLAFCTYEDALTYELQAKERRAGLSKAADEFEQIHVKYRSQGAGLRARLWQGKCYEEQGDLRKAMGIYFNLLSLTGDNETIHQVKDYARQFRLACLNHESNKDYALVVNEATQWLTDSKSRQRTSIGLGIRWQRAVAADRLAAAKDAAPADRDRWRKMAAEDAREVGRFPGEFQGPALALASRMGETGVKKGLARDFASGFNIARKDLSDIQEIKERLDAAPDAEKPTINAEFTKHLEDAARNLRRTLAGADLRTDRRELNQARYFLAFVEYELKDNDEAIVLADYAARRLKTVDPELARESARLALAACEQEFNAVAEMQRAAIARAARPIVEFIAENWPDHERASESRIVLARMFDRAKEPLDAAKWYSEVAEGTDVYAEAQIGAGREYWIAAQTAPRPAPGAPADKRIAEWMDLAEKHLQGGIQRAGTTTDLAGNAPDWLIVGKAALANIAIGRGKYADAEKLLTGQPHSVIDAMAVNDETTRPPDGVKGRPFAGYVLQSLLRANIGLHQIDAALRTMQSLEKVTGAADAEGVTGIYVSLGKEIEKEVGRLIASNDRDRLNEVRKSFDEFLEELYRRRETMTYGSLLWVAETYAGLGEGMLDDTSAAREYFGKAARTYDDIIAREGAAKTPQAQDRMPGLQLRLGSCLSRQGDFQRALAVIRDILAKKPKALDAQFAAATVLQEWGASKQTGADVHSLEAIGGLRDGSSGPVVWGWAEIAARIQRLLVTGRADSEYREKYFEARYNIPRCRRQYALAQSDPATRTKALEVALGEIHAFSLVSSEVSNESWQRLDALYQGIERDLKRPPAPLQRPDPQVAATKTSVPDETESAAHEAEQAAKAVPATASAPTEPPRPHSLSPVVVVLGLIAGVAAVAVGVVATFRRQKPTRLAMPSMDDPEFINLPSRPSRPPRATRSGEPAPGDAPSATLKSGTPTPKRAARPKSP